MTSLKGAGIVPPPLEMGKCRNLRLSQMLYLYDPFSQSGLKRGEFVEQNERLPSSLKDYLHRPILHQQRFKQTILPKFGQKVDNPSKSSKMKIFVWV